MTDKPQEPRDLIQICTDIYYECETVKRLDELTDEALDWHNKQIEAVLDRLLREYELDIQSKWFSSSGGMVDLPSAIEAERNKLKESSND